MVSLPFTIVATRETFPEMVCSFRNCPGTTVSPLLARMYNGLASKVYDVLEAYAQLKGYTIVLDISEQQSPVLWANDNMNITKDIIDAYNVKSGIPAPAAAPAAALPAAPKPAATPAK